ncbi:hypothetical protein [Haloferula sp.]|uniref:hypothetical protein n=1 Tax=Haloferula sp. TaxID=2497595 RepID=UPI003C743B69
MSEESDRVWEGMSGELRKVRRRRLVAKLGTLAAVGVLGMFLVQRMMAPLERPTERVVDVPVVEAELGEMEPAQFAVLVYDGEGMRFELRDADQFAGSEMELSLQPVVMTFEEGVW